MRLAFPALVLVTAIALAQGVRMAVPEPRNPGIELLNLSAPTMAVIGETVSVYAGLSLPEGRFEKRFRYCGASGCRTNGWGAVTGPGEWWGYVGAFAPPEPGRYEAELLLFERTPTGAWITAARRAWSIDVR